MEQLLSFLQDFQNMPAAIAENHLVQTAFSIIKGLMSVISIILAVAVGYVIMRMNRSIREKAEELAEEITIESGEESAPKGVMQSRWEATVAKLSKEAESEWKLAIIEADKVLEEALKAARFPGESLGDILRQLDKSKLANLDAAWQAHRIRNAVVHEPKKPFSLFEAKNTIDKYGDALRELGVID